MFFRRIYFQSFSISTDIKLSVGISQSFYGQVVSVLIGNLSEFPGRVVINIQSAGQSADINISYGFFSQAGYIIFADKRSLELSLWFL